MPNEIKVIKSEPRSVYRCNCCKNIMEHPNRKMYSINEYKCDEESLCTDCETDDLSYSDTKCKKCGTWLFSGDDAYEIGDDVYCTNCVQPVEI